MGAYNQTILRDKQCEGRDYVDVDLSFAPNGASALVATGVKGKGVTVARTSAGLFTITFANGYVDLICATATAQLATAADINAQIGTYTAPTATASATLTVRLIAVATETDVAANANNRVNVRCTFAKSSVTP
jgi:hypothetical protein